MQNAGENFETIDIYQPERSRDSQLPPATMKRFVAPPTRHHLAHHSCAKMVGHCVG